MKIRHALVACLVASGPSWALDHMNPVALHAAALERLLAGDAATAEILLARAARLAPDDSRITRAREALRKHRAGEPVVLDPSPARAPVSGAERPAPAAVPPEPPPLWPAR